MKITMKLSVLLMLLCFTALTSCSSDDDNNLLSEAEVPVQILDYIETHFPSNTIIRTELDRGIYEIDLSENLDLEFNSAFEIIYIDSETALPDSVIPDAILDYVAVNYPDNFITDWELELNHQEVELNTNLELEFEMNGTFIRIDND